MKNLEKVNQILVNELMEQHQKKVKVLTNGDIREWENIDNYQKGIILALDTIAFVIKHSKER